MILSRKCYHQSLFSGILSFLHMIFLALAFYLTYIVAISLQLIDLKWIFSNNILTKVPIFGVIIAFDVTSLLLFGIGGFLLFFQIWLFGTQMLLQLERKKTMYNLLTTLLMILWGLSLTIFGNFLLSQGSIFFSDTISFNVEALYLGSIVLAISFTIWGAGNMINRKIKNKKSISNSSQRQNYTPAWILSCIIILSAELISFTLTWFFSNYLEIFPSLTTNSLLLIMVLIWFGISILLTSMKLRIITNPEPILKSDVNKKKRHTTPNIKFELGNEPDSVFYKRDDAIDKKLAQNPDIFLKEKQAAFDRPQIGTDIKKPLYIQFECPICKEKLSMGMMCHQCEIRVCPQCLNPDPIDTSVCKCGYTFTSISRIVKFSKLDENTQDVGGLGKFDTKSADGMMMPMKGKTNSILPINIDEREKNYLKAKGETNGTRFCPICHIIGWKEDVCQCGYNYLTKKLESKK